MTISVTDFVLLCALVFAAIAWSMWIGWWLRGLHESRENAEAMRRIGQDQAAIYKPTIPGTQQDALDNFNRAWEQLRVSQRNAGARTEMPEPPLVSTETSIFTSASGQTVPSPNIWDQRLKQFGGPEKIAYEDLEGMFLDQFLLRYFYSLMPDSSDFPSAPGVSRFSPSRPWDSFILECPWAKELPLLFEQMTGYALNEIQLNNAIAEWVRRVSKSPVSS